MSEFLGTVLAGVGAVTVFLAFTMALGHVVAWAQQAIKEYRYLKQEHEDNTQSIKAFFSTFDALRRRVVSAETQATVLIARLKDLEAKSATAKPATAKRRGAK